MCIHVLACPPLYCALISLSMIQLTGRSARYKELVPCVCKVALFDALLSQSKDVEHRDISKSAS